MLLLHGGMARESHSSQTCLQPGHQAGVQLCRTGIWKIDWFGDRYSRWSHRDSRSLAGIRAPSTSAACPDSGLHQPKSGSNASMIWTLLGVLLLVRLGLAAWRHLKRGHMQDFAVSTMVVLGSGSPAPPRFLPRVFSIWRHIRQNLCCTAGLGSGDCLACTGGHTAEMLTLLSHMDLQRYSPRSYVIAATDKMGASKANSFEAAAAQSASSKSKVLLSPVAVDM